MTNRPRDRSTTRERRRHARVAARLPLAARTDAGPVEILASNLSEGGAYGRCARRFPIMTRLDVTLDLPGEAHAEGGQALHIDAVVVRCEPDRKEKGTWNLALLFREGGEGGLEPLARFLDARRRVSVPR